MNLLLSGLPVNRLKRLSVVVLLPVGLLLGVSGASRADFLEIDETYFGTAAVVGEDIIEVDKPALLGFDLLPGGAPVDTPNPNGWGLFYSDPLQGAFESVGVRLGADDVGVTQPSDPEGIGMQSAPNALASDASSSIWGPQGTTEIMFVDPSTAQISPTPAAGAWFADGPTNEVHVAFYDGAAQLIVTLVAPSDQSLWFAGIQADQGIAKMEIWVTAPDDYYTEDLYYIPTAIPEPCTLLLLTSGGLCLLAYALGRRKRAA